MISTYRYGGHKTILRDGKSHKVEVSARDILEIKGPFMQVSITHPKSTQETFIAKGNNVPSVQANALIDTGASTSIIASRIADKLNLVQTGFQKVFSVQDEQSQPVFYAFIVFPWGNGKEIPIISCPVDDVDFLIGRDILRNWHVTYNGVDGSITICD